MRTATRKLLPETKNDLAFRVLGNVLERMFEPEGRRLQRKLDRIVDQQEEISPSGGYLCFIYDGEIRFHSRSPMIRISRQLDYSLWPVMDEYLKDKKEVEQDQQLIRQALFKCIFNWRDAQDFRNRMPDVVVPILSDGIQNLQRTVPFEEATCLTERDKKQFEKLEPKIALYATARLIY